MSARILGVGSYLPEKVLSNADLEKLVETSDEWIVSRTGMKERRIASQKEPPSFMGAEASKKALKEAGIAAEDIDLVIAVTMSPDYLCPSTAALIQDAIGARNAGGFDLLAACSGYIYGLSTAKAFVESGIYKNVLMVATEKMSAFTDYEDRSTCVLFGDGASAAVISSEGKGLRIDTVDLGSDGSMGEALIIPSGGSRSVATQESVKERHHYIKMDGRVIFKQAVRKMGEAAQKCLESAGMTIEDVSWIVPHQANIRIIDALAKHFDLPRDRVCATVHKYGNTSASSVGITLDELRQTQTFKENEKLLLLAVGGGLTWGAVLLTNE